MTDTLTDELREWAKRPEAGHFPVLLGEAADHIIDLRASLAAAQVEIAALREDAERLEWALPILSGDDTPEATARALKLACAVLMQLSGRAAIDSARKAKKSPD